MTNWDAAITALLASSDRSSPPVKPTRDELCTVRLTFQGMIVDTEQYGSLRWFPPVLGWLDLPQDRKAAYAAHRAAGDTHVNLALSSRYASPGQQYTNIPGRDFSQNLPALHALIEEAIGEGFKVLLMLAGDGNGAGPGYNDPGGWTYGRQWLMQNFQRVYDALEDVAPWIVWCPGYDGVVPAWGPAVYQYPSVVDEWLLYARSVIGPDGALALELAAGYAHWGGDGGNYINPAGQCLDVVLSEFPYQIGPPDACPAIIGATWDPAKNRYDAAYAGDPTAWMQVWQIVARLAKPYFRPAGQPMNVPAVAQGGPQHGQTIFVSSDSANPPYYLAQGTPRGRFFYVEWEFDTYGWVRWCPLFQVEQHRAALRALADTTVEVG